MLHVIKLILIYIGYQLLCTVPVALFSLMYSTVYGTENAMFGITAVSVSLIASSLLMLWHTIHFGYVKVDRHLFSPVSVAAMLLCVLLGLSSMFALDWLNEALNLPNMMENTFEGMKDNVFGIFSICLLAPVVEEVVFRGAIEGSLLRSWRNPCYAIFVSALIFGFIHGNPAQIPFAFLIGLLLGWLYYRTGSLLPGIFIHFLNNTASVILMNLYPSETTMSDVLSPGAVDGLTVASVILFVAAFWAFNKIVPQRLQLRAEAVERQTN